MTSGKTLSAVWAMRNVRETLTPTERHVLHAFFSFMNSQGVASPGIAALVRETGYVKRTVMTAIEALVREGLLVLLAESQAVPVKRCAVYKVVTEAIEQPSNIERDPVAHEHVAGDRSSGNVNVDHVQVIVDPCSGDPGAPFEDLEEDHLRTDEDHASHPLASSRPAPPSPTAPEPTTARSPATMLTPSQPLPELAPSTTTPKTRKPRGKKPTLAPLTVDVLTAYERAVHDAIVTDPTLSQICHDVPQLARDLVALADGKLDVVAKVKALAAWNRNNPAKAWKTTGGNRGLTTCIPRDAQGSRQPSSARSTHQPAPANHDPAPLPPRQKVYAPPPPPKPVLVSGGSETFLERMARLDPQAKSIIERHGGIR